MILSYIAYTPKTEQLTNTYYESFIGLFVIYAIYVSVIYVTLGILVSCFIDLRIKRQLNRILCYVISGAIIGGGFYLIATPNSHIFIKEFIGFMVLGSFASLLFWGIQKFFDEFVSKCH